MGSTIINSFYTHINAILLTNNNHPTWSVLSFNQLTLRARVVVDEKSMLTVEKRENYSLSKLSQLNEIPFYDGKENPVRYTRQYHYDFSCGFQLHYYPFDTQVEESFSEW